MACMTTRTNLTYSYVTYFDYVLNYGLDSERCRPNLILALIGTVQPPTLLEAQNKLYRFKFVYSVDFLD